MAQKSNLTIEVLSIIGGVLTAIFFLGFLVLSSILRSETSCLITGSILIITTLFVNRLLTKPFLDAMNITCYIAGCILAGYGMNRNMDVLFIVLIGDQCSNDAVIQRVHPDLPFGNLILYGTVRRDNEFILFTESAECGCRAYYSNFLIRQSI